MCNACRCRPVVQMSCLSMINTGSTGVTLASASGLAVFTDFEIRLIGRQAEVPSIVTTPTSPGVRSMVRCTGRCN